MKGKCSRLAAWLAVAPLALLAEGTDSAITIGTIFAKGGWVMYIIGALSVVAIALTVFYILTFKAGVLMPSSFILKAQGLAADGDIAALKLHCDENDCAAAKVIAAGFSQEGTLTRELIREGMEDEGSRQGAILWQRLQYIMDIAVISPMVGLLGTVWGMMLSFGGIENGADFAKKAETMASGVAQAMYTTFGGLIVGIFAMAIYGILRGRLNSLTGQLEAACLSVLNKYKAGK